MTEEYIALVPILIEAEVHEQQPLEDIIPKSKPAVSFPDSKIILAL